MRCCACGHAQREALNHENVWMWGKRPSRQLLCGAAGGTPVACTPEPPAGWGAIVPVNPTVPRPPLSASPACSNFGRCSIHKCMYQPALNPQPTNQLRPKRKLPTCTAAPRVSGTKSVTASVTVGGVQQLGLMSTAPTAALGQKHGRAGCTTAATAARRPRPANQRTAREAPAVGSSPTLGVVKNGSGVSLL